jgi:hypothetical protein
MRVAFGHHTLELKHWPSQDEMIANVTSRASGHVLLGENARQYRDFFSLDVRLGFSGTSEFGIGVYSEGHGLSPHLLLLPEKEELLFGLNNEIACVSVREKALVYHMSLDSLFRSFVHLKQERRVLVFHEIGLTVIDEAGNHQWSYAKDILTDCVFTKTGLELRFLDEPSVTLEPATGTVIST